MSIPRRGAEIDVGQRIRASGLLRIPFETEDFSYQKFLAKDGIFSVMSRPTIVPLEHTSFSGMRIFIISEDHFERFVPIHSTTRIRTGSRNFNWRSKWFLSPEREQDFRKTGLAHLVALSGYNVTILCVAVFGHFFGFPKPHESF